MKTVKARDVTNMAMVNGNESKYSIVIHNNIVKEWVGIGWIELREPTKADLKEYPHVLRS